MADDDSFLSRWSRRKAQVRQGVALPPEPVVPPATPPVVAVAPAPATDVAADDPPPPAATVPAEPPPTLEDVARLDRDSSFARFVKPDVAPEVKSAALKKLFSDPHFNVMDGLDIYIDDYGKPDPMPSSMLRQLVSAQALGLFRDEEKAAQAAPATNTAPQAPADAVSATPANDDAGSDEETTALPSPDPCDEDADLRLQPNDAAGCAGAEPGAGEDAGRQH